MRNDMIDLLSDYCKKIELDITDTQLQQFDDYFRFLVEKNKVMNLTTIIEKEDVVLKHFIDSIYIMKYTDFDEKKVIDIGTGAGFPGIPLAIMNPQTSFVLLDSLNNHCAKMIADYYKRYDNHKGTQFVFSDLGTYRPGEFNVYSEIKRDRKSVV